MGFEADELALVRSTLRHAIDTNAADAAIGALLAEGWADLVDADPSAAISTLAEEVGTSRSAARAVDLAVLWGAGVAPDASTAVIHDGIALAGAAVAERFVWLTGDAILAAPADSVSLSPAAGLDPALGAFRAEVAAGAGTPIADAAAAERALAAGRRALASQMVGAAEQMLADTVAYVNERQQYGRPIGSFQAVKHRLADAKVAATAARVATVTAWEYADSDDATTLAIAAKCLAGRAQTSASTHCFQVHGGIAFTAEHGFQDWVRRGMLLDLLLGDHQHLTAELGRRLLAARRVPRVPDFRAAV
jgi:hypothetical protein